MMKYFILTILFSMVIGIPKVLTASSYIFIQGDKQTPIYVKVNGKMAPRLGLNYCIVSNLDKGDIELEILFQENKIPSQKFIVTVPENGSRGFLLTKLNNEKFALFDLQSKAYIPSGNTKDEAFVDINKPREDSYINRIGTSAEIADASVSEQEQVVENKASESQDKFLNVDLNKSTKYKDDNNESASKPPRKSSNKSIRVPKIFDTESGTVKSETESTEAIVDEIDANIPNSDCPEAMSTEAFELYAGTLMNLSTDEIRLRQVRKTFNKQCFSVAQVEIMANLIESQSAKFELVKTVYPRVIDQGNYGKLESVFISNYLKGKFREMLGN